MELCKEKKKLSDVHEEEEIHLNRQCHKFVCISRVPKTAPPSVSDCRCVSVARGRNVFYVESLQPLSHEHTAAACQQSPQERSESVGGYWTV